MVIPSFSLSHNTPRVRSFVQGEYMRRHSLPNNEFTTRRHDDGRVVESQVPESRRQWHALARAGSDVVRGAHTFSVSGVYDVETHVDSAQVPYILAATGERARARSSLDLSASVPLRKERAELLFTFRDMLNDFGVRRDVVGDGFRASSQMLETQVATARVRWRF